MNWVPIAIGGWLVLSLAAALVIGTSIRRADRRDADAAGAARASHPPPGTAGSAAGAPDARGRHPADGTRSSRLSVVRDCLPASERQPATPTAGPR